MKLVILWWNQIYVNDDIALKLSEQEMNDKHTNEAINCFHSDMNIMKINLGKSLI